MLNTKHSQNCNDFHHVIILKRKDVWDFPGGPFVGTSPFTVGGVGSIPGQGAKIPQALWPKRTINIKQK